MLFHTQRLLDAILTGDDRSRHYVIHSQIVKVGFFVSPLQKTNKQY